jgi:hypothetical protein
MGEVQNMPVKVTFQHMDTNQTVSVEYALGAVLPKTEDLIASPFDTEKVARVREVVGEEANPLVMMIFEY